MFVSETVFVLGAGASHEVGLPVGSGLAQIISKKVDVQFTELGSPIANGSDLRLYGRMREKFKDEIREYQHAGWTIRDGVLFANSIDDFLDRFAKTNERVVRYGKLAIVASILEGERESPIFTSFAKPRSETFITDTVNTWYAKLLKVLGTGVGVDRVETLFDNVSFIDFNYDRCLPHFMIEALQPLYGIDEARAREVVSKARILHPYGSLGPLTGNEAVPFGDPTERTDMFEVAERIRLYTEQVQEHEDIEEIRRAVSNADRLVFLGFGYHPQNIELITPRSTVSSGTGVDDIIGSAFGISQPDVDVLQDWLYPLLSKEGNFGVRGKYQRIILANEKVTAAGIFDVYSRKLMS